MTKIYKKGGYFVRYLYYNTYGSISLEDIEKLSKVEIEARLGDIFHGLICYNNGCDYQECNAQQISNILSLFKIYNKNYSNLISEDDLIQSHKLKELADKFRKEHLQPYVKKGTNESYYYQCMYDDLSPIKPYIYDTRYWYDTLRTYIQQILSNDTRVIKKLDMFYNEYVLTFGLDKEDTRLFPFDKDTGKMGYKISMSWGVYYWKDSENNKICTIEKEDCPSNVEYVLAPKYEPKYKVGDYSSKEDIPTIGEKYGSFY
jgi:hypothetical protein